MSRINYNERLLNTKYINCALSFLQKNFDNNIISYIEKKNDRKTRRDRFDSMYPN